jgi:hypothetical protein
MKFLLFEAQVNSQGGFATSVGRRLLSFDLVIKPVINRLNNHFVLIEFSTI